MSQDSKIQEKNHTAWDELKRRYPDRLCLDKDVIYALPVDFIHALNKHLPGLWSKQELQFEYDLNEIAGMGLFLKQPFWYPLLKEYFPPYNDGTRHFQAEHTRISHDLRLTIEDCMRSNGCSELMIKNYFKEEEKYKLQAQERQIGYAGWLVTDSGFQLSNTVFLGEWWGMIQQRGEFPSVPPMKMLRDTTPLPKSQRPFYAGYTQFYYDWSLERLATPHLPVPMHSNPVGASQYSEKVDGAAGLTLFIPWYLLADQDLKLHDIANHHLMYGHKKHLQGWFGKDNPGEDKPGWGYNRFSTMLKMFVFLECGLYARYRERLNRKVRNIDEAFTEFLEGAELDPLELDKNFQSTRKTRQELQRRLKKCREAVGT
ncbi:hypothetical protein V6x_51960 [Gimesia chilikensis]|uniref:Uncharacterized protein n=2 Tax=Gimesia TaxID=1649453 RepID=A0A6I6ADR6_9PLAN|nr:MULTISPECIES: hypothetical protein [Gimesia]QDU05459.1 hypothetical protein V6x_51960 [Gimesia chilikensis]QGQ24704.1 hypothetical protein F1728_19320 [Gimesia benthica]